tara:strand:- start:3005 stop:3208 length:204 start_codon:yes stop_codon:yes gene_type:complete
MKLATKIVFLACLIVVICVPIIRWALDPSIEMGGMAGFVGASGVPLGVLTGAMAVKSVVKQRNGNQG